MSLARILLFCHHAKEAVLTVHSASRDTWNKQQGILIYGQSDMLVGWAQISVREILQIVQAVI